MSAYKKLFIICLLSLFVSSCAAFGNKRSVYDLSSQAMSVEVDTDDNGAIDVNKGGTNSTSAANARTSLGCAESGANSTVTSLSGLTTPLSKAQGGTGLAAWFDITPGSEGWQGAVAADAVAGEALSIGDIVYRKNVGGVTHYFKYSSNSTFTDNATYRVCGIATTAAAGAASTFTLGFGQGVFRMDSYTFVDADRGKTVFASETAGQVTLTAPSDVDDLVYPLGAIISPDVVEYDFKAGSGILVRVSS